MTGLPSGENLLFHSLKICLTSDDSMAKSPYCNEEKKKQIETGYFQWRVQDFGGGGAQPVIPPTDKEENHQCTEGAPRARSASLNAWGPGARVRAPDVVQGQSPGGGPGGEAPGSSCNIR